MSLPTLLRTRTGQVTTAFVGAVLLFLVFGGRVGSGTGQVIDSKTGAPIAGAEVRFNCQTSSGLENWRTLRWVSVETNEKGVYRFWPWDVFGCDAGALSARKEGYVSLSSSEIIFHTVAGYGFQMSPEAEATLRRLELMHSATVKTAENAHTSPFASTRAEYHYVYFRFIDSKTIAQKPREKAFVVENYCARLQGLYDKLSPEERIELAKEKEYVGIRVPVGMHAIDHEGEVVPYCTAGH